MVNKYPPINNKCPHFLHGGDYNPEQWENNPGVWEDDMRLMKKANCNVMTIGVFSWSRLEPEEGRFDFEWMDTVMDNLAKNNAYAVLATPSGARPAWMSAKYPEVLRVNQDGTRILHGNRHNHCYTSPVYRSKCSTINRKLAERYKNHPALLVWHVSNEYGGECHCELCQDAFREWLKKKYGNDLDKLNHAWWTNFWSHKYTDWNQIHSPSANGEESIHGLNLDWKRFVTDQSLDFMKNEIIPLRELAPQIPITSNFMAAYPELNYWKFAKELDVISWDTYPVWHTDEMKSWELGCDTAFLHDIYRSLKGGKPFMVMECTPSLTNWRPVNKLKRPDVHMLTSMQAVAHGSDTVQYFQWRKSRGGVEKFHGAVIDHSGYDNTRVFSEVAKVGDVLSKLDKVVGSTVKPEVAIIFDWENRWAIEDCQALRSDKKEYQITCEKQYRAFWTRGIPVDIIEMDSDFSSYKLLIAPMLYMIKPGTAEKIERFVENGGTFITTYWSGMVDENDLCFLGGFPGPLRKVTGIWSEEIDTLYDSDENYIVFNENNSLELNGQYKAHTFCDLIHAEDAEVLAVYGDDFYKGRPALTVNCYGKGKAYYIASRNEERFIFDFYGKIIEELGIKRALDAKLPKGVTAQLRTDGEKEYVFLLNFNDRESIIEIGKKDYKDVLSGKWIDEKIILKPYETRIIETDVVSVLDKKH